MKMNIVGLPAVSLLLVAAASFASAGTVTFTDSFTGTGTLGSNSFTDSLVTISGSGDTANVHGTVLFPLTSATITIASLNQTVNLTAPFQNVQLFNNNNFELTALSESNNDGIVFGVVSNALNGADFSSQVGPVDAQTFFLSSPFYATDGGSFNLAGPTIIEGTSTFTLNGSATPEPATIALFGFGLLALPAFKRLRNSV
jgi:hypothetical protein